MFKVEVTVGVPDRDIGTGTSVLVKVSHITLAVVKEKVLE